MALTNKFIEQVASFTRSASGVAEKAHVLGIEAVKAAYSNQDLDKAQYLMDNIPQYLRKPFSAWFRRCGLDVAAPDVGSARFSVLQVIDQKRQSKAFTWASANPVLDVAHEVKAEKKVKELKGTPDERAHKAMQSLLTRLKESDPEASAILNDAYATMTYSSCLFDADGRQTLLDGAELELIRNLLIQRELRVRIAA
jgi:hypothetical protein